METPHQSISGAICEPMYYIAYFLIWQKEGNSLQGMTVLKITILGPHNQDWTLRKCFESLQILASWYDDKINIWK